MYKEILQNIDQVQIWPLISFVIFFVFFLALLIWVFTVDKKFIHHMKGLPLNDNSPEEVSSPKDSSFTKTTLAQ